MVKFAFMAIRPPNDQFSRIRAFQMSMVIKANIQVHRQKYIRFDKYGKLVFPLSKKKILNSKIPIQEKYEV